VNLFVLQTAKKKKDSELHEKKGEDGSTLRGRSTKQRQVAADLVNKRERAKENPRGHKRFTALGN